MQAKKQQVLLVNQSDALSAGQRLARFLKLDRGQITQAGMQALGVVDPLDKLFQIGLGISKGLVFFEIGITIFFGAKQTLRGSGEQHTRICFGNTLHKAAFYGKRGARGTQLENQRSFRIMDTCAECTLQGASSLSVCLAPKNIVTP